MRYGFKTLKRGNSACLYKLGMRSILDDPKSLIHFSPVLLAKLVYEIMFGAAEILGEIGRSFHLPWDGFRKNVFVAQDINKHGLATEPLPAMTNKTAVGKTTTPSSWSSSIV